MPDPVPVQIALATSINSEADLQAATARLLDDLGLLWCHVPNETKGPVQWHAKRRRMGVKPGVPDVLIFGASSVAIELKHGTGRLTESQRDWLDALQSRGWRVATCRTMQQVVDVLRECGYF